MIAQQRNLETERKAEMRQAEDRLQRLAARRADLEAQRGRAEAEVRELTDAAGRLAEAARRANAELHEAEEGRVRAVKAVEEAGRRRAALAEERATKGARLEVLERLIAAREGVEEGARAVLGAVEGKALDPHGARDGVLGLLADLVEARGPGAAALDRLLGHAASAVVVTSRADALRWIHWLKARGKHERARFLCLDLVKADAPALPAEVGALGGAPALARLVASVVAGTELVADLEAGIRAWDERGVNAVTIEGERVTSSGALLAGRDGPALGLVERIAELRRLREERTRLGEAVEGAQADVVRAQQDAAAYEERIRALRRELAGTAEDSSRSREALARLERASRDIDAQIQLVESERGEFEQLHADASAALVTLAAKLEGLEGERLALEERAEEAGRGYLAVEAETQGRARAAHGGSSWPTRRRPREPRVRPSAATGRGASARSSRRARRGSRPTRRR